MLKLPSHWLIEQVYVMKSIWTAGKTVLVERVNKKQYNSVSEADLPFVWCLWTGKTSGTNRKQAQLHSSWTVQHSEALGGGTQKTPLKEAPLACQQYGAVQFRNIVKAAEYYNDKIKNYLPGMDSCTNILWCPTSKATDRNRYIW